MIMLALSKQQVTVRVGVGWMQIQRGFPTTVEVPRSLSSLLPLVATYPYLELGIRVRPMACYHLQHIGGGGEGVGKVEKGGWCQKRAASHLAFSIISSDNLITCIVS